MRMTDHVILSSSSPLVDPWRLKIAFNVEELPTRPWLKAERLGLATGWFHSVAIPQLNSGQTVKVHMMVIAVHTCAVASFQTPTPSSPMLHDA